MGANPMAPVTGQVRQHEDARGGPQAERAPLQGGSRQNSVLGEHAACLRCGAGATGPVLPDERCPPAGVRQKRDGEHVR